MAADPWSSKPLERGGHRPRSTATASPACSCWPTPRWPGWPQWPVRPPRQAGGLRRRGNDGVPSGRRRRPRVAVHCGGILSPHFAVVGLGGRDRRPVWPQQVRRDQRCQLSAVSRDHLRRHRHENAASYSRRGRRGLVCGLLSLGSGGVHPCRIWRGRGCHRCRRRAAPSFACQPRDDRAVGAPPANVSQQPGIPTAAAVIIDPELYRAGIHPERQVSSPVPLRNPQVKSSPHSLRHSP